MCVVMGWNSAHHLFCFVCWSVCSVDHPVIEINLRNERANFTICLINWIFKWELLKKQKQKTYTPNLYVFFCFAFYFVRKIYLHQPKKKINNLNMVIIIYEVKKKNCWFIWFIEIYGSYPNYYIFERFHLDFVVVVVIFFSSLLKHVKTVDILSR